MRRKAIKGLIVVVLAFASVVTLWILSRPAESSVTITDLRCEGRKDPLGVDEERPRLSWTIRSGERGEIQTAYQILAASTLEALNGDSGDLWDSGRVVARQSAFVRYGGRTLPAHAYAFWKVRVWDRQGRVSDWSTVGRWSTGVLGSAEWRARWIGLDGVDSEIHLRGTSWIWHPNVRTEGNVGPKSVHFRRVVHLPEGRRIKRAVFQYTGDSECGGWLNDSDLGIRNDTRTVKWHELTNRLESGKTYVFGLVGRSTGGPSGVLGLLTIEFESGEPLIIKTDEGWRASEGDGAGWRRTDFDDSKWVPAKVLGPAGMAPWGPTRTAEDRRLAARWLRSEFVSPKPVKRAIMAYAGLGLSEVYLNGQKVSDHVLSPALSDYDKRIYYVTLDVTSQVRRGNNAIGAVLGGGRYYPDRSAVYARTHTFGWPKLLLQLRVEHDDGSVSEVMSEESWRVTTDGPILSSGEFDGEEYDARKELGEWSSPGYDDSRWQAARLVAAPKGVLESQPIEPIRVIETLRPAFVSEPRPGVFVFDLGQNMAGWCRLKVSGPAGTTVRLRHAERLEADGSLSTDNLRGARATDQYTLKGEGVEVFEPRFTYHGFRYVEVEGLPGKPNLDTLEGRVVHDDLPKRGTFASSNELLNRIYRSAEWSVRSNYRSIPTDCPQRDERQGWLGDRGEGARGESYLFDHSLLYEKWLKDIRDTQLPDGSISDAAPRSWMVKSDNVTWPSTFVIAPNMLERQFGDRTSTEANYPAAKKLVEHMLGGAVRGITEKDTYGDWCVPPEDPFLIHSEDPARMTSKGVLATAFLYHDVDLMSRYATKLGKVEDARRWTELAAEIKVAFNAKYLDRARSRYDNGSQTSSVLPLAFGLVPEDMVGPVFGHLVNDIEHRTKGHIGTGLVGVQYLLRVLSDNGRADLAYAIATQTDYPSWGYMIERGATTIWELWNGDTADASMSSHNHVMLIGDLVTWLYERLAGIAPDEAEPGFRHVIMRPHPVDGLQFVRASLRSPYGEIRSEWKSRAGVFDWQVVVPSSASATVFVPAKDAGRVQESNVPASQAPGVTFLRMQGGRAVFQVGSGTYHFLAR